MLGALVGDINGSIYQYNNGPKNKKFRLFTKDMYFTDDSLLTIAVGEVLDKKNPFKTPHTISELKKDLVKTFVKFGVIFSIPTLSVALLVLIFVL